MYIAFHLPSGAGGMAAAHKAGQIRSEVAKWAAKHEVPYKTKIHKYTLRVILESEHAYTHFQLSWNPSKHYSYELIEPGAVPPDKLTSSP